MGFDHLYRDIVEGSSDGIWLFDLAGDTIHANPALARMFGAPREEFARLSVFDSLDDEGKQQFRLHLEELARGEANPHDVECRFVRRDGTHIWVLVGETLLTDPDGHTMVLHRLTDYDERRRLVDELTASRRELAESQRIARLGSWTWDLVRNEIYASESLFELYDAQHLVNPVPPEEFFVRVHPDELPTMEAAVARMIEHGEELSLVTRVRAGDGDEWVWVRARGVAHRDDDGRVVRLTGTHQDITETRLAEVALEDQVTQNLLMQAVASTANEARTLHEVLERARALILQHDDWRRGRAFVPLADGSDVRPVYITEQDRAEDVRTPEEAAHELELARRCLERRDLVWDEDRLTIAFPVIHEATVHAVLTITSHPPLYRYEMIETNARQTGLQLARVVERELHERELATARDEAMEASRQKSEFLARMSHEIRTPLNGVIGLNELLLRTDLGAEQLRLVAGVRTAGENLLALINDILDFSKIEAGMLELEEVPFAPRDVVAQTIDILSEIARGKAIDIRVDCDSTVPGALVGDPTRLGQVLLNLGSNAVKFTSEGEVVFHVSAEATADRVWLRVEVHDTGVGLGGLDVATLFESFAQGDASTTRTHGGTGLGLAISREIVHALGGEIGARPAPGRGSVFWFTAGFLAADGSAGAATRRRDAGAHRTPSLQVAGRRPRILVVEDHEVNRMVAVGLLEALDCDTETAVDGVAALESLATRRPDLVLMDVQMPRMDGHAATRELRRLEAQAGRPRLPVIAMTAGATAGQREQALAAGMDGFLTKPVEPQRLADVLGSWLGRSVTAAAPPAPPAGPEPEGVLDLARLDMLRDMADGDTSYLDRVIGRFVADSPGVLDDLEAAVAGQDVDGVRHQAHRLAGNALNIGVPQVAELARLLEHIADEGTTDGAAEVLPRLGEALASGRTALVDYQKGHRSQV